MTPEASADRHGLGDPRIPWVIVLDVALSGTRPEETSARDVLGEVARDAGWAQPSPEAVCVGAGRHLLGTLTTRTSDAVRVGLHPGGLVVAARHDALDGLAMLTVLGRLLGHDVRSSARGVDAERLSAGRTGGLVDRAWEVVARPQARVAASGGRRPPGDSFASTTVDRPVRTADLVHAGARAVVAWNRQHGAAARRVSVAVGVSTVGGASYELADRSAFLRLRDVEALDRREIAELVATAPLQIGSGPARTGLAGSVTSTLLRMAAPRLGSTLLVSHLGSLDGPDEVAEASFYPVTGGGSGVSLGAATIGGRTTVTLRGRGSRHDDEGLERLLALVVDELRG